MQYTIQQVGQSLPAGDQFNNLRTMVSFQGMPGEVAIVHQAKNQPRPGETLEGSIKPDQYNGGQPRFFKDRQQFNGQQRQTSNYGVMPPTPITPAARGLQTTQNNERVFKADPAKGDSIESQSYYHRAIDLIRIHAEMSPESYDKKSLRELNDLAIDEARHAKSLMRSNTPAQALVETGLIDAQTPVYDYTSEQVPIEAYDQNPPMDNPNPVLY